MTLDEFKKQNNIKPDEKNNSGKSDKNVKIIILGIAVIGLISYALIKKHN
jgi:hypothetical protein